MPNDHKNSSGVNSMKKEKSPPGSEQGVVLSNMDKDSSLFKDIPNTIPGCFGDYENNNKKAFLTNCDYCDLRLECVRQSIKGGNNEQ